MTATSMPAAQPVTHPTWRAPGTAVHVPVTDESGAREARRDTGEDRLPHGCGGVSFAGSDTCGVRTTPEIMTLMAGQSAAQCGPCVFAFVAVAEATGRLAVGAPSADDLGRIGWGVGR